MCSQQAGTHRSWTTQFSACSCRPRGRVSQAFVQLYQCTDEETEALRNQEAHLTPELMLSATSYSGIQRRSLRPEGDTGVFRPWEGAFLTRRGISGLGE